MIKEISIIGGDLRIVKLANILNKDGYKIYTYGMDEAEMLDEKILKCNSMEEAVNSSKILLSSIPFSKDGELINSTFTSKVISIKEFIECTEKKSIIGGNLSSEITQKLENKNNKVIDILQKEELTVLNAVATAEGALQIALEESENTLHGSKILILGFGRIGKILAKMLKGIGAEVCCEARKKTDIAWIKAYGYYPVELTKLENNLNMYDFIFNTVPYILLNKENLKKVKKDCLIIDLASNPGGVDQAAAKKLGLKYIWALSLPGKVAPSAAANYIKEALYNIFEEMEK